MSELLTDSVEECDPYGLNAARAVAAVELFQRLGVEQDVIEAARLFLWRPKDGRIQRYPNGLTPGPALNKAMALVGENFEELTERAKDLCGYRLQLELKGRGNA